MEAPPGLGTRTLSGAIWTSAGETAGFLLHWAVFVVLARLLNAEDFGIFALALVVVGLGRLFGEMGLAPAVIQRGQLGDAHVRTAFTIGLLLSLLMGALVFLSAPLTASLLGSSELVPVIRMLAMLFVLRGIGLTAGALLQRDLRFPALARADIVSYFIGYGCVGIGLAFAGAGYWALAWAAITQTLLESLQYTLLRPHPKRLLLDRQALRDLLSYGAGASMGRLGNYLALKGDYVVAGRLLGTVPLGIYSRAYGLMSLPVGIYQNIASRALFSAVAKVQDDLPRLAVAHRRAAAATALLLLPTGVTLSLLAPEVVGVVLGSRWTDVVLPFQFMALGLFFRSGYNVGAAVSKGAGEVHRLAIRQWIYPVLVVLAAWMGAARGVAGIAAAVVLAIIVHFIMVTQLSLHCSSLRARDFAIAHVPAAILAMVVGGVVWVTRDFLRGFELPAIGVILGCFGAAGLIAYALMKFFPRFVLGRDGMWFVNRLGDLMPTWVPRLLPLHVPTSR
jgi:PST family polysaccharide transporter